MATNNLNILKADLENQIIQGQLTEVNELEDHFVYSSLGLASKSNKKWCKIYYISYFYSYSVNSYTLKGWDILEYITFDKAKQEEI